MGKMDTPQNLVEWSSKAVKRLKSKGEERIISDASQDSLMNVHQLRISLANETRSAIRNDLTGGDHCHAIAQVAYQADLEQMYSPFDSLSRNRFHAQFYC